MSLHQNYQNVQRIIIVSTNWLGDSVITIPTIYGIRSLFPQAHISILARETVSDIFLAVPAIDEIIRVKKNKTIKKIFTMMQMVYSLRKNKYDMAVIFPRSFDTALTCFLSRIPTRVGFHAGARDLFLSEALPRDDAALSTHQVNYYKRLLVPLGKAVFPELPFLKLPDSKKEWAQKFLSSTGNTRHAFTVGLNPGAIYGPAKQWSPDRFTELARRLSSDHDCEIIIIGDKNTSPLARTINSGINGKAIDATGKTDVLQLAALLESCDILVTNDTGPMHVACAVGTSVIAIFGSTDPEITSPLGPEAVVIQKPAQCSPCLKRECPEGHYRCLKYITVDDVETSVLKQLNTISSGE